MDLYDWVMAVPVRVCMARWGGGAKPGKTHVYFLGTGDWMWDNGCGISLHCVVDDFGNLVRVS